MSTLSFHLNLFKIGLKIAQQKKIYLNLTLALSKIHEILEIICLLKPQKKQIIRHCTHEQILNANCIHTAFQNLASDELCRFPRVIIYWLLSFWRTPAVSLFRQFKYAFHEDQLAKKSLLKGGGHWGSVPLSVCR